MKKILAFVAVLFIIAGFGMIHSPSQTLEYISIAMMGLGTSYLIFLILTSGGKEEEGRSKK
jgi:cyanate permease